MRATHGCPLATRRTRALFGAIRAGPNAHFVPLHRRQGPHGRGGGAHPQGAGRFPGGYRGGLSIDQCLPHHGAGPVPRNAGAAGLPAAQAQQVTEIATGVRRESIESALDAIEEKYPSFEEYLRAEFEIGAAELEDIRARYLV